MRLAALWLALSALVACKTSGGSPHPQPDGDTRVERVPFTGYAFSGVRLFRVTSIREACNDCDSYPWIEGVDEQGTKLDGAALFLRSGRLEPDALARRALDLLLGRAGGEPLVPGKDAFCMEDPETCALMAPAGIEGDRLTFWINEGSMHPTLTRVAVDLKTAAVEKTTARTLAHPPPDPVTALRERLADPTDAVQQSALSELLATPRPEFAAEVLQLATTGTSAGTRGLALRVLETSHDEAVVTGVTSILEGDADATVRRAAARTLAAIGSKEAVAAVRAAAGRASVDDAAAYYAALRAAGRE